ncbi:MAG: hypothetical protein RLZZ507_393 [Cyanobacteriota bacterium]|jgi:hypothetical protein
MNIKTYKHFNLVFFSLVSSSLLTFGLFNLLIDPYELFSISKIKGVNQEKPVSKNNTRLIKAIEVTRIKPKTILLGSSTALRLSTNHPVFANSQPVYNLALPGSGTQEQLLYFQHALFNQPDLKKVVIGLDFFSFGIGVQTSPDFVAERLQKKYLVLQDALNAIFSFSAFQSSWTTLTANLPSKSEDANSIDFTNIQGENNNKSEQMLLQFQAVLKSYFQKEDRYKNYQLSPARLNDFQKILEICKQKNIDVKVFFSPTHAVQMEGIHIAGLWPKYEQWQREVVKITPVWDFTGYTSVNTENVTNEMKNYVDGAHYQYRVADLILNRIFQSQLETVPLNFGVLLTPDTIESHQATIRTDRIRWQSNNPKMVKFVEGIYFKSNK